MELRCSGDVDDLAIELGGLTAIYSLSINRLSHIVCPTVFLFCLLSCVQLDHYSRTSSSLFCPAMI